MDFNRELMVYLEIRDLTIIVLKKHAFGCGLFMRFISFYIMAFRYCASTDRW